MHSAASLRPAAVDDDLSAPALPSGNRTRPLIAARLMCRSFLSRIDSRVRQESLQRKLRSHRASGSSGYSLLLENGRKDDLHANIHDTVNQCTHRSVSTNAGAQGTEWPINIIVKRNVLISTIKGRRALLLNKPLISLRIFIIMLIRGAAFPPGPAWLAQGAIGTVRESP
jgi:hypothetical protein